MPRQNDRMALPPGPTIEDALEWARQLTEPSSGAPRDPLNATDLPGLPCRPEDENPRQPKVRIPPTLAAAMGLLRRRDLPEHLPTEPRSEQGPVGEAPRPADTPRASPTAGAAAADVLPGHVPGDGEAALEARVTTGRAARQWLDLERHRTQEAEILQLDSLGYAPDDIALALGLSRTQVAQRLTTAVETAVMTWATAAPAQVFTRHAYFLLGLIRDCGLAMRAALEPNRPPRRSPRPQDQDGAEATQGATQAPKKSHAKKPQPAVATSPTAINAVALLAKTQADLYSRMLDHGEKAGLVQVRPSTLGAKLSTGKLADELRRERGLIDTLLADLGEAPAARLAKPAVQRVREAKQRKRARLRVAEAATRTPQAPPLAFLPQEPPDLEAWGDL